jgi:cell division protein FtsW
MTPALPAAEGLRAWRWRTDPWLVLLAVVLVGGGLIMVLSASQAFAVIQHHFAYYYFLRQVAFAGLGFLVMVLLARTDYRGLRRLAAPAAAAALALMVAVLVTHLGVTIAGARRWIDLGPLGTFEPSEVTKLAFAVYIAHWLEKRGPLVRSFAHTFVPFVILSAVVLGLEIAQRDLGTALVTGVMLVAMYFAGGGRKRYLIPLLAMMAGAFALLVMVEAYRSQRLAIYLNPFRDPLGAGFQSSQALLALGSGGLTGVGLGHSVAKYQWLPEAHTDFIFAIIGEETGLVGATVLLAGFLLLAVRGYRAACRAPDRFGLTLGVGVTSWITFQALLNMAAVTDTLPITGVPLPFISYGGTALAINMAAVGVLLSLAARGGAGRRPPAAFNPHTGRPGANSTRRTDATSDRRRRHRRAPVAGAGGRARVRR